jgi:hypothetical protein
MRVLMRSINEIDDLAPSVQRLSVELDLNWEWYPLRRRLVASSQCAQRYSAGCYVRTLDPRRQYDVLTHWEWEEMSISSSTKIVVATALPASRFSRVSSASKLMWSAAEPSSLVLVVGLQRGLGFGLRGGLRLGLHLLACRL